MKVALKNVRLAFCDLFVAKDFNNDGKFKFGSTLLFEPGSDNEVKMREAINAVAREQWKAKAKGELVALEKKDRTCLHDGADKDYDGFDGMLYVNATNTIRPTIVDQRKAPLVEADGKPYAGCYANAIIDVWAQDNQWGKRINASLSGVQFVKDGEAFAGGKAASIDEFDEIEDDDDDFADLV